MQQKYDLEERTFNFAKAIILLCKKLPHNILTISLINQLIRSATSIGANYSEANGASSKKDFRNKIFICKKEAKETVYWLKLLLEIDSNWKVEIRSLLEEADQLTRIFNKISSSLKDSV